MADYWISADNGSIYTGDCRVGDVAATASQIAAWQAASAPAPSCALWQLQAVVTPAQWAAVQAAIAAMNNPALSAFAAHGSNVIPANSTTLLALGTAIGLDASQVAALVTQAAAVAIP